MKITMVSDAELVRESLGGKKEAFGVIVERYKSLVSAITYNVCGSLAESEELAQEAFLAAWKDLRSLREPEKLRAWLCGIARHVGASRVRRKGHGVLTSALSLDHVLEQPALEPEPADIAISREEEKLMWGALEQIPETYREPLILFYREQCSVRKVAEALDLSEDAAKQRLSRGRQMLQDQIAKLLETTLQRSIPGRAFTWGVVSSLPMLTGSATAATLTATAVKGSSASSAAATGAWIWMLTGPLVGVLGAWFGIKMSLDQAESTEERETIIRWAKRSGALILAFLIIYPVSVWYGLRVIAVSNILAISLIGGIPILYAVLLLWLAVSANSAVAKVKAMHPGRSSRPVRITEWRSKATLFGLPLVHISFGRAPEGKFRPAIGWIAIGDVAAGLLLACGGISVGTISLGGAAVGIFTIGGAALGVMAFGGLALGWMGVGGVAIGVYAAGGAAFAWEAAIGGLAVASEYALGGSAIAAQSNNAVAQSAIRELSLLNAMQNLLVNHSKSFRMFVWIPVLLIPLQMVWISKRRKNDALESK